MLFIARHGQTDYNCEPRRFQGHHEVSLNEKGFAQARELGEAARSHGFVALYSSPLLRARQTAKVVGEAIGLTPVVEPELAETDTGDWTNQLEQDVEVSDPVAFAQLYGEPELFRYPGGESFAEQQLRVLAALARIREAAQGPTLIVCHRGCIRVALCEREPLGLGAFHQLEIPNGALLQL